MTTPKANQEGHKIGAAGTCEMDCGCGFYRQGGQLVVARCTLHHNASLLLETLRKTQVSFEIGHVKVDPSVKGGWMILHDINEAIGKAE